MAAESVDQLREGADWSYELKLDGYRAILIRNAEQVQLLSRNRNDLTRDYPSITAAAKRLTVGQVTLDGEIVALDATVAPEDLAVRYLASIGLLEKLDANVRGSQGKSRHRCGLKSNKALEGLATRARRLLQYGRARSA